MEKSQLHISVRSLVEFIFREGDIDNRSGKLQSADAMLEGTRIHRKIQKSMGDDYQAEVPLKRTVIGEYYDLTVEGRADGVFTDDSMVWIDEIKGMYRNLDTLEEPIFVHQAQAMCYAFFFAEQNALREIGVQLTYCNLDTEEKKYFRIGFSFAELYDWFDGLIKEYGKWSDFQFFWRQKRQASIKNLSFPYPYRPGQKKLVEDVYRTILRGKNLFLQAPTGVGKTISTIFPAVKAVGEELAERVFYLTAKTITATVAKETFLLLREHGYRGKIIQITAKEKMCMCEEMDCNPLHCPFAKGHYDRVNEAIFELLQESDIFTREDIERQARKHRVCPFEMCLDAALFADDIICDYNYLFDPNVYLKRFFQEGVKGKYIFLVDESHNLVERSRQMYSAQLYKEDFLTCKKWMKPYSKKLEKLLDKCNRIFLEFKRECGTYQVFESLGNLYFSLLRLMGELDEFLQKPIEIPGRKEIVDFYFSLRHFINIYELVDEHYVMYGQMQEDGRFMIKLFCVDPSLNLQNCIDRGLTTVFFSATLLPIQYYKNLLSTKEDNYAIYAKSTFLQEQHLLLFGRDVSTKYTRRNWEEFQKIAAYIECVVTGKKGNYMVFFPSYKLMEQVAVVLEERLKKQEITARLMIQTSGMKEGERESFLEEFEKENEDTLIALCVLGGIFGEGIDLKNERLIGAIVVGTGLPQTSDEREILKRYYDSTGQNGFDYAYRFPGMNKVLQAAGRVIRTEKDEGVIVLLDERFLQSDYLPLFPREWEKRKICTISDMAAEIKAFWKK